MIYFLYPNSKRLCLHRTSGVTKTRTGVQALVLLKPLWLLLFGFRSILLVKTVTHEIMTNGVYQYKTRFLEKKVFGCVPKVVKLSSKKSEKYNKDSCNFAAWGRTRRFRLLNANLETTNFYDGQLRALKFFKLHQKQVKPWKNRAMDTCDNFRTKPFSLGSTFEDFCQKTCFVLNELRCQSFMHLSALQVKWELK